MPKQAPPVKESHDTDFQRRATLVGAAFEVLAEQALLGAGFTILQQHFYIESLGIQVDFRAQNKQGVVFLVECKGSLHGDRPGLERTDTVKKALCNAFLLEKAGLGPFLLLTSHVPSPGTDSYRMLRAAGRRVVLDVVGILEKSLIKRMEYFGRLDRVALDRYVANHPQLFDGESAPPRTKQLRLPIVAAAPKPRGGSRRPRL